MFENLSDILLPLFPPPLHSLRDVVDVQERAHSDHMLGDLLRPVFLDFPSVKPV